MVNLYLYSLIDPSFEGVNRLFVLTFVGDLHHNVFHQPVKTNIGTYDSIWKISTGQGLD